MTKIYQYLHYPNATELGQGSTHETYLLIGKNIDLSGMFPVNQSVSVSDVKTGKRYTLKSSYGNEFRVNQFGPIYRDDSTQEGDEICLTGVESDEGMTVYLRVEKKNRITLSFMSQGAFFNNESRLSAFGSKNSGYTIPVVFNGQNGNLTIKFVGQKKKRADSPDLTDFYEVEFAGTVIKNGNYILDLDTNEFSAYQKASMNIVSLSGEIIPESATNEQNGNNDQETVDKFVALLYENKNLILTGAPGTGKTYLAKEVASAIIGGCPSCQLTEEQKKQIGFVQFHPSYDYTDFVEGLRPVEDGDFKRQDGVFKQFCKDAINGNGEPFVFIIDEINRGELSKIFGELFYSIEPNYRGIKGQVKTQYNAMVEDGDVFKPGFYIPDNIYIIGTMNDVDRSVESMDFAIRRRFIWKEVTAADSATNMGIEGLALVKMNALNKALGDNDLPEAYWIGGAYFLNVKDNDFKALWDLRLKGVVSEYFRGDPEASRKLKDVEEKFFAAKLDEAADDGDSTEKAESSETE
jgi:hypothetical protein